MRTLRGLFRLVLLAATLAVIAAVVVAGRVWQVGQESSTRHSDAIIVMGTAQYDGRPSELFADRLEHARVLYGQHVAARIVTIGGNQPGDRFTEAGAGATWLAARGVPRSALVEVAEGRHTLDSLQAAGRLFAARQWHTAVIVSDRWHLLRSRTMARQVGIDAVTSPVTVGPSVAGWATEARYIARESAGYVYYRLFHTDRPPDPRTWW